MAEGGREPQEVDFSDEDFKFGPLRSESPLSGIEPLDSKMGQRMLSEDEGLPRSPESVTPVGHGVGIMFTPRTKDSVDRLDGLIVDVLQNVTHLSEANRMELKRHQDKFEELKRMHIDSEERNAQLRELITQLERMQEEVRNIDRRTEQRLDEFTFMQEEQQRQISNVDARNEHRVKEEVEGLRREFQANMQRLEAQWQPAVMNNMLTELVDAVREAHKERDEAKERFQVTVVKLRKEEENNSILLERIDFLERRCMELETENQQLRLGDIVQQTHFVAQGPLLECFSCRQKYSTHNNPQDSCLFHPLPRMRYDAWRNCIDQSELPRSVRQTARNYFYWACCNVLANRMPEGCSHGRHHQQWERDIVMRQVLARGDTNSFSGSLRIL